MATKKENPKERKKEVAKKEIKQPPKQVSSRTFLIIVGVLLLILLLAIYFYKWYDVKKEEKLRESYLMTTNTVNLEIKDLSEVSQLLTETPNEYFVLISYTGDEQTYKLEQGLKEIIDNYKLGDRFYYLNIENILNEDDYLTRLNTAFDTDKIKKVPTILYYKDGEIIDTVKRVDDNPINAGDFQKLLDIYEYEGQ